MAVASAFLRTCVMSTVASLLACSGPSSDAPAEHAGASRAALDGLNGISANLEFDSQWGQGYCVRVVLENAHPSATTGTWEVVVDLGAATTFTTWDGVFSGSTGVVSVTPEVYNAAVPPAESRQFGFCASIPSAGMTPALVSVTSDLPSAGGAVITEYQLDEAVDPMVSPDYPTELWAAFYRPEVLEAGRKYPLLVFLHGNHPTCGQDTDPRIDDDNSYALTGACPPSHPIVVPNHRGYDYIATDLAARGYFVVSVNANRGIHAAPVLPNDEFAIGPRARLVLRHLERLSLWNAGLEETPAELGVDLEDRIDFDQVGLFGHSRGGESVRLAYNEYRASESPWPALIQEPVTFRGIFEIGPTDELVEGQLIDAPEVPWNVLLPACDWDQSDLPGVRVFDRMLNAVEPEPWFKSFYHVWGTNHNFYNSEWMSADASIPGGNRGCFNHEELFDPTGSGSAQQRETGRFAAVAFFTANVGTERDEAANAVFDPAFPLSVPYRVNRGYHPGGNVADWLRLEDFINPSGTSSYGLPNDASGVTVAHVTPHGASHYAAYISEIAAGPSAFFQTNFAPAGSGFDLTGYDYLDVRADRAGPSIDDPTVVTFSVELVNDDDTRSSAVSIGSFLELGAPPRGGTTLPTARIPLSSFTGAELSSVRAVRLTFPTPFPSGGGVFVANIRATRATTDAPPAPAARVVASTAPRKATWSGGRRALGAAALVAPERITAGNVIERIEDRGADGVDITLASAQFFELRGRNLVLSIGDEKSTRVRFPSGSLYSVRFTLPSAAWSRVAAGDSVQIDYGAGSSVVWDFGALDRSVLKSSALRRFDVAN